MPRDWLLSGVPRSGTSLSCRLAGDLPDTVALSEPFNVKAFGSRMPRDPASACNYIGDFVERVRNQILAERRAPSVRVADGLYDNIVASEPADSGLRQPQGQWGHITVGKPLSARFALVVRENAVFAALLPRLNAYFPCLAVIRNPMSILASWQTVNLPVHRGRLPGAEHIDRDLHRMLEQEPNVLRRQIIALNWLFGRFHAHLPPANVIRYEDLVGSGGVALFRRLGHADAEPVHLKNRNSNPLYDPASVDTLLKALLDAGGPWIHYYTPGDCEHVAGRIRHGRKERSTVRTACPGLHAP